MYLDYAENRAARRIAMKMADWIEKVDAFYSLTTMNFYKMQEK